MFHSVGPNVSTFWELSLTAYHILLVYAYGLNIFFKSEFPDILHEPSSRDSRAYVNPIPTRVKVSLNSYHCTAKCICIFLRTSARSQTFKVPIHLKNLRCFEVVVGFFYLGIQKKEKRDPVSIKYSNANKGCMYKTLAWPHFCPRI